MTIVSIGKEIGENYLFEDYAWKSCIDRNIFKITLSGSTQYQISNHFFNLSIAFLK